LSDWVVVAGTGSRSDSLAGSVGVTVVAGAYASVLSVRCVLSDEIPASAVSGAPGSSGGAPFAVSGFAPYSFVG